MKTSNFVFGGIIVIFLIFGLLTSFILLSLLDGLIVGYVSSWIFKKLGYDDRKLAPRSQISRNVS